MAIEITKRPYSYCFSGNPVHYELYSALAAADPDIYFEIKVLFKPIGGAYQETPVFQYAPVAGFAPVDVKDILEGFLTYTVPGIENDEKKVREAAGHTGMFYLQFRQITLANSNPGWDNSEEDFACFVIKGGVSSYKYQGNNFWIHYMDADVPMGPRPFLTWQQSGRLAAYTERMYLAYLVIDNIVAMNVKARATYTDNSQSDVLVQVAEVQQGNVYYLPAGAGQWGFPVLKDLWYWEIWVETVDAAYVISQTFRYKADNRQDYNDLTIHYRNSISGFDSVRVRGVISDDLEYDWQELQKILQPDYYSGYSFQAQKEHSGRREVLIRRGDIGHLGKEEQDRLRDAYLKETWIAVGQKWVPVLLLNKNIKLRSSDDNRWKMPIDFVYANEGETAYTPESVDLGTGVFTSNVCKAMLSPLTATVDLSGAEALVTVTGDEVDPQDASDRFRYRLLQDGLLIIDWTIYEYVDLPLVLMLPKDSVYNLETQAICLNAVHGKKVTMQFNTAAPDTGGGGTPPPTSNSQIRNNTSAGTIFRVVKDGFHMSSAYVGAYSSTAFAIDDAGPVTIDIVLDFSPSYATLTSNGITYTSFVIFGNVVRFEAVQISNGMIVEIY